jgi:hypothetical protein
MERSNKSRSFMIPRDLTGEGTAFNMRALGLITILNRFNQFFKLRGNHD